MCRTCTKTPLLEALKLFPNPLLLRKLPMHAKQGTKSTLPAQDREEQLHELSLHRHEARVAFTA